LSCIKIGDIVTFKRVRKINLEDLIARRDYSKYMLVVEIIINYKDKNYPKAACKVLCANGEVNWVSINSIERT
tara:strand:- start:607 stop:825 length:219 start_codon:yes stop_codon:yes gene_type:complete